MTTQHTEYYLSLTKQEKRKICQAVDKFIDTYFSENNIPNNSKEWDNLEINHLYQTDRMRVKYKGEIILLEKMQKLLDN
jgi:hypothetical protein